MGKLNIFFISFLFFLAQSICSFAYTVAEDSINSKNTYLKGQIFIGENPLPAGKILLFQNSKSRFGSLGNATVENGNFMFENILQGEYIIYAIPEQSYDSFYYPKYLPTYSGSCYRWENALPVVISSDTTNYTLKLLSFQQPYYGHGTIKGNINYESVSDQDIPLNIILLDANKTPMDFTSVSANENEFEFDYLPAGTYYIYPEKTGVYSNYHEIEVENDTQEFSFIEFNIKDDKIELIEKEITKDNPVIIRDFNNYLLVNVENYNGGTIVCELIDVSGKFIHRKTEFTSEFKINTTNIMGGLYFLRIKSFDNKLLKISKVFINN